MNVFITGGAGFIGANVADHHLRRGDDVTLFDSFRRQGTLSNLAWLRELHGDRFRVVTGDIRDFDALRAALAAHTDRIYHLAAQVAVTTSVGNPREDFEINAVGTFNVVEAVRQRAPEAVLLYSSTNKVYGEMESIPVIEDATRYRYLDGRDSIAESEPLDFHSPYGCSKGSGDQYVRDYARIYGLRTVVLRQSCIYGERQLGVEDQGWLAHFCISASLGRPITIYGNGKQVRDVLWVDDLIAAYNHAAAGIDIASGQAYNIGGGPQNTLSVWAEFGPILEELAGRPIPVTYAARRPGDQPIYVSDIRKAWRDLNWQPRVSMQEGTARLWRWVSNNKDLIGLRRPAPAMSPA